MSVKRKLTNKTLTQKCYDKQGCTRKVWTTKKYDFNLYEKQE